MAIGPSSQSLPFRGLCDLDTHILSMCTYSKPNLLAVCCTRKSPHFEQCRVPEKLGRLCDLDTHILSMCTYSKPNLLAVCCTRNHRSSNNPESPRSSGDPATTLRSFLSTEKIVVLTFGTDCRVKKVSGVYVDAESPVSGTLRFRWLSISLGQAFLNQGLRLPRC
jgi:hypothetical protein